jgi:hypothetical protein
MTAPPAPRPGRRLDQGPNGQLVGSSTTPLDDLIIYHRERQLLCLPGSGLGCGLLHVLPRVLVNLQELRAVDSPVCSTATCGTCSTIKRKVRLQRNTQRPHSRGQTSRLLCPPHTSLDVPFIAYLRPATCRSAGTLAAPGSCTRSALQHWGLDPSARLPLLHPPSWRDAHSHHRDICGSEPAEAQSAQLLLQPKPPSLSPLLLSSLPGPATAQPVAELAPSSCLATVSLCRASSSRNPAPLVGLHRRSHLATISLPT